MKRPFLTIGLAMLCSMYALFYIGTTCTVAAAAVLVTAAAVCAFFRRRESALLFLTAIAVLTAVCCFTYADRCKVQPSLLYCGENVSVSGTLSDYPVKTNERYVYTLKNCTIAEEQTDITIQLSESALYKCKPGDRLHFVATKLYSNLENDQQYYFSTLARGEWMRAYTQHVTVEQTDDYYRYAAKHLRHTILQSLQKRLPTKTAAVVSALVLGDKTNLDRQTELIFRLSGLSHLFAVSGFHVSFWTGLVIAAFGNRKHRKKVSVAAIAFLVFFMALTGFSVSVCRAGIMLLTVCTGNLFRRDADSLNSLGLALTVLLLANPFSAADASLLLSASATAAILLTSEPTEKYVLQPIANKTSNKNIRKYVLSACNLLCLSTSVSICLFPLTSLFFGSVSLLTPFANLFCMFPAQITMILGMFAQIFHRIPWFSDFLFRLTEISCDILLQLTSLFANASFSRIILYTDMIMLWAAGSAVIIFTVSRIYKRQTRRIAAYAMACFCLLLLLMNISLFQTRNDITVHIQNTGNGSCISVHNKNGDAAVFGCGGNEYTAESLHNYLLSNSAPDTALLLIPRQQETESANAKYLAQLLSPDSIISAVQTETSSTLLCDSAQLTLWEGCNLYYKNTENFSGVSIQANGKNIVLCFSPSSDFTTAEACFRSGDLLICRQSVPVTVDHAAFEEIILSADKPLALYHYPQAITQKTISTADEGSIERILRQGR